MNQVRTEIFDRILRMPEPQDTNYANTEPDFFFPSSNDESSDGERMQFLPTAAFVERTWSTWSNETCEVQFWIWQFFEEKKIP